MNKKQIIDNELNKLQNAHRLEERRAKAELLHARNIPEYCTIDDEIRKIRLNLGKLDEKSQEIKQLEKELSLLQKKSEQILKAHKINPANLLVHEICPKCNDTGYIENTMCECLKINVQKALIAQSGINGKLNFDFSKSDTKLLEQNTQLAKIHRFAQNYCENFPHNKETNLIFWGEVGTGKTFLLECIANELLNKLHYVVFSTAYDISKSMVKAYNSPYNERDTILAPLFECDLLIIDDLGTEPLFHESTLTNLFTLINERQRNNKPIIYSTNLTPEQIDERYGNRIKSRIFNDRITMPIKFSGFDLRLKK